MTDATLDEILERATRQEAAGEWTSALRTYEDAWRLAVARRDADGLVEVATRQGHCYRHTNELDLALEQFVAAARSQLQAM